MSSVAERCSIALLAMQTFIGQVKKPPSPTLRRGRRSASQHNLFRYANVLGLREEV
jgi:hypothetical protein